MPYYFFHWYPKADRKIAENGVTREEFEAVVSDPDTVDRSRSSGRPIALGDIDGSTLVCIYEAQGDDIIPVTAYWAED